MLVEAGLVLALQGDRLPVAGGSFTPAACQVILIELFTLFRFIIILMIILLLL